MVCNAILCYVINTPLPFLQCEIVREPQLRRRLIAIENNRTRDGPWTGEDQRITDGRHRVTDPVVRIGPQKSVTRHAVRCSAKPRRLRLRGLTGGEECGGDGGGG